MGKTSLSSSSDLRIKLLFGGCVSLRFDVCLSALSFLRLILSPLKIRIFEDTFNFVCFLVVVTSACGGDGKGKVRRRMAFAKAICGN